MRERKCRAWILVVMLAGGCTLEAEPLIPAAPLSQVQEHPAEVAAAEADGTRPGAQSDSTGRWGGSLGSGS